MARIAQDWTIAVDIKANGDLDYGAYSSKKVWKNDRVEWTSRYDIAVIFAKSPFTPSALYLYAPAGGSTGLRKIKKPSMKKEHFKYTVALWDGSKIILDDPVIIVDDDGGGGGDKGAKKSSTAKRSTAKKKQAKKK